MGEPTDCSAAQPIDANGLSANMGDPMLSGDDETEQHSGIPAAYSAWSKPPAF